MKEKYTFPENRVTTTLIDGFHIWIAFIGTSGITTVYKSSAFNPENRYYDIDIIADELTNFKADDTYIYGSLDDSTSIGIRFTKETPSTNYYFAKQAGITEKAIDVIYDATYVYFLTPGEASGLNAKICKYNISSRAFVETIDLLKSGEIITNAKSMTFDGSGNIWIVTYTDPIKLVKVYGISGGEWDFDTWELT